MPVEAFPLDLPADVWVMILENLTLQSIGCCIATSKRAKSAVCHALTSVRSLYVDRPSQLRSLGVNAALFPGLRDLVLCSFDNLRGAPNGSEERAITASSRALPQLVGRFPVLESLSFGHCDPNGELVSGIFGAPSSHLTAENRDCVTHLLEGFSGSYHMGLLQDNFLVRGLYCPRARDGQALQGDPGPSCRTCRLLLNNFPISQAIGFSSCLGRNEAMETIKSRPGGIAYLRSEARFFQLLSNGSSRVISLVGLSKVQIVQYGLDDIAEMRQLIDGNYVGASHMEGSAISCAITKSFMGFRRSKAPSGHSWYLDEASFDSLKRIGLPLEENLLTPLILERENMPVALKRMVGNNRVMQIVSAKQIVQILSSMQVSISVAQQIIGSGVLPILVVLLQKSEAWLSYYAVFICRFIACSSKEHAEAVADVGAIPHLSRLLGSTDYNIFTAATGAMSALSNFCPEQRPFMVKSGTLDPLMQLLSRPGTFSDPYVSQHGMNILANLCNNDPPTKVDPAMIQTILQCLHQSLLGIGIHTHALSHVFRALCHLSNKMINKEICQLICNRLVEMLSEASQPDTVRKGAYSTLDTIMGQDPSQLLCLMKGNTNDAIPCLLENLINGDDDCKQYVCQLIDSMIADDPSRIKLLMSPNYIEPLIGLTSKCFLGRLNKKMRYLRPFCDLLTDDDSKTRLQALFTLEKALKNLSNQNFSSQQLSDAVHALIDVGLRENLVKLLLHDADNVCMILCVLNHVLNADASHSFYLLDNGALPQLSKLISDRRVHIQGKVCSIAYLMSQYNQNAKAFVDSGCLIPLIEVLKSAHLDRNIKNFAPKLILNMLRTGVPLRDALTSFHQVHNPSIVKDVDEELRKHAGREAQLFRKLAVNYNLDPSMFGFTAPEPTTGAIFGSTLAIGGRRRSGLVEPAGELVEPSRLFGSSSAVAHEGGFATLALMAGRSQAQGFEVGSQQNPFGEARR